MFHLFRRAVLGLLLVFAGSFPAAAQSVEARPYYDNVRGWKVVTFWENGNYAGCGMARPDLGFHFGLARENGDWFLLFPSNAGDGSATGVFVDIGRYSEEFELISQMGIWGTPIPGAWIDEIAAGSTMGVDMNGQYYSMSLSGTTAGILKVEECDVLHGSAAQSPSSPPPNTNAQFGAGCPFVGDFYSPNSQDWATVTFYNTRPEPVTVYWIGYDGAFNEMAWIGSGDQWAVDTSAGHLFVARGAGGRCYGGAIEAVFGASEFFIQ